jgi:hypothetical protein
MTVQQTLECVNRGLPRFDTDDWLSGLRFFCGFPPPLRVNAGTTCKSLPIRIYVYLPLHTAVLYSAIEAL